MKSEIKDKSEQPSLEHSLEGEAWAQAGGLAPANGVTEESSDCWWGHGTNNRLQILFFFKENFNLLFCHH